MENTRNGLSVSKKKEPAQAGSGMLRISDDREDVFQKYELDECEPGYDPGETLESVSAALADTLFEPLGKPFQIIPAETLSDEESRLDNEACDKERKI